MVIVDHLGYQVITTDPKLRHDSAVRNETELNLTNNYCLIYFCFNFQKADSMNKLYEMDDNPERRIFLDRLLHYMDQEGTPIQACPQISKNPLDLFKLYILVKERG